MSKGLEALDKAMFDLDYHRRRECQYYYPKEEREEYCRTIEKELKALEIIKEMYDCKADMTKIISDVEESADFQEFSAMYGSFTKEMYDLLREAFE